jgi:hypothetical protein
MNEKDKSKSKKTDKWYIPRCSVCGRPATGYIMNAGDFLPSDERCDEHMPFVGGNDQYGKKPKNK